MSKEKIKKQYQNNFPDKRDVLSSSCSFGECTGLIPTGSDLTEEEFKNYQDVFQFSVPSDMSE